jgi:glycosyltransferase involved in cell wall biosynthesis
MQVTLFQDFAEDRRTSMEVYADGLIRALQTHFPASCRVHIYRPQFPTCFGTSVWGLRLGRFIFYPQVARSQQSQVNHVLDHGYGHLVYTLERTRTVVTVHDLIPLVRWKGRIPDVVPGRKPWLNIVSFHALKRAAHLIAISENTRRDLIELCRCAPEKITVIYYGVNSSFRVYDPIGKKLAYQKWNLSANCSRRILIAGSSFYKNQTVALQAFAQLRKLLNGPVELLKVGSPDPDWMQAVEQLGLSDVARCLGVVHHREMADLYNSVDCLLFPSLYEGFGWPPLEAMACGTPVVSSNAASLPEVVEDAGLMCTPQDYKGLAQAMYAVLMNEGLRRSLIERGLKRARQFTWERTAQRTLEVYERVANGSHS